MSSSPKNPITKTQDSKIKMIKTKSDIEPD
jgi:hypothetical protein